MKMNSDLLRDTFNRVVKIINDSYGKNLDLFYIEIRRSMIWLEHDNFNTPFMPFSDDDPDTGMRAFLIGDDCLNVFDVIKIKTMNGITCPDIWRKLAVLADSQSLEEINIKLDILGL